MLINHLDKIFVTSDTATLLKELEVAHPAAKIMVMAAQMQEAEIGDGSNLVIILIGELLAQAGQGGQHKQGIDACRRERVQASVASFVFPFFAMLLLFPCLSSPFSLCPCCPISFAQLRFFRCRRLAAVTMLGSHCLLQ